MEVSGQLHALVALLLGNESLVHIGWEAGWAPELVWARWWTEKFKPSLRLKVFENTVQSCWYKADKFLRQGASLLFTADIIKLVK